MVDKKCSAPVQVQRAENDKAHHAYIEVGVSRGQLFPDILQ